jgi:hypothetical protein
MAKILEQFERKGDKENSKFFEQYLPKIYERREKAGIDDLLTTMRGVVIQVQTGEAIAYISELYLMSPYRFEKAYRSKTHNIYALRLKPEYPVLFILEPLEADYYDMFTGMNASFPRAKEKVNVRYLGEILNTKNLGETVEILQNQEIRFQKPAETKNKFLANSSFRFTDPSYFSNNILGYTESDLLDLDSLGLGDAFELSAEDQEKLTKMNEAFHAFGFDKMISGIDHLATRVFCGSREDAILEFMTMSNYYFWGAYNIDEMNSSTNVNRNPNIKNELLSPAKVFTANNTPFYVKSIDGLPSPTEDFVRNFGRRMHHMAYEVVDGELEDGTKNIDYVVGKLSESDIPFLAKVIGECTDMPDLKQIFSKSSQKSFLITEYVQRCKGYDGFFAKTNVAALTAAAGEDEKLKD